PSKGASLRAEDKGRRPWEAWGLNNLRPSQRCRKRPRSIARGLLVRRMNLPCLPFYFDTDAPNGHISYGTIEHNVPISNVGWSQSRVASSTMRETALIVGAGPAGLTAAHELLERSGIQPVILEAGDAIGGICRTVEY